MNRKQLGILIALVVVIGGASLVLRQKQDSSWTSGSVEAGKKLLGEFPVNDIARLTIKQGTNEVNLIKQDDLWRVQERSAYPADYPAISAFLLKARDLKAVQAEQIGPSQLPRLDLAPGQGSNSPVTVEFRDNAGKMIGSLRLGKKHLRKSNPAAAADGDGEGWPDGRYVQSGADTGAVALIADALETVEPRPEQWLNRDFVRIEKAHSVTVDFPGQATNSWKAERETEAGEWKLADAKAEEPVESSDIAAVASALASPRFNDVVPSDKLSGDTGAKSATVTIETFEGFVYTLNVGEKTGEDYPVTIRVAGPLPVQKPEDKARLDQEFKDQRLKLEEKLKREQAFANWTFQLPAWVLEPVLKRRSDLVKPPTPQASAGLQGEQLIPGP